MRVCYCHPQGVVITCSVTIVTFMAGVIFTYTWLVPVILWTVLSWQGLAVATMLETIAIYGYSLTIYIPICVSGHTLFCISSTPLTQVLWLLPIPWLQWILVAVGVVMSGELLAVGVYTIIIVGVVIGLVMLIALRPSPDAVVKRQFGNIIMLVMILLHAGLGVGFKVRSFTVSC